MPWRTARWAASASRSRTSSDMETLLDGIPLDKISISMTINSTAIVLLSMLIAVAKQRGVDPAVLRGTVQNDMFKEFIARGTQRLPVRPSLRLVADVIEYATRAHAALQPRQHQRLPHPRGRLDGRGGGRVHARRRHRLRRGGPRARPGRRRLRAAASPSSSTRTTTSSRRSPSSAPPAGCGQRIMQERFGAQDPRSLMLRFHTQTAGSTLQARQVDVNVVRVTLQALAAVLGGTQSLHTNSRDEALSLPSEQAAVLALRTQQVLGPRERRDRRDRSARRLALRRGAHRRIEARPTGADRRGSTRMGGTLAADRGGLPAAAHREERLRRRSGASSRARTSWSGVNRFEDEDDDDPPDRSRSTRRPRARAIDRVRAFRARARRAPRPPARWPRSRGGLGHRREPRASRCSRAVEAHGTIGEIVQVLEARWGTFQAPRG